MRLASERNEVCLVAAALVADGLVVGTSGNVSRRCDQVVAITPSGVPARDLQPAAICLVDLDGQVVDGELAPSSELPMHLAIYRRRNVDGIVHTHSPYATAIAAVFEQLPAIHYLIATLGGPLQVVPYQTYGTQELAEATAAALDRRDAALLRNHGVTTVGDDLEAAYARAVTVEWLCQVFHLASTAGTPALLDDHELAWATERLRGYGPRPTREGPAHPA